jgi:hypothetical protein
MLSHEQRAETRRRDFVTMISGAAAAWPIAGQAQKPMPIVGFLGKRILSIF